LTAGQQERLPAGGGHVDGAVEGLPAFRWQFVEAVNDWAGPAGHDQGAEPGAWLPHSPLQSPGEHPMTRTPQQPRDPEPYRTRITLAVITGILAGTTRALTSWLIDHLTTGN
jgi:hypothetical protein